MLNKVANKCKMYNNLFQFLPLTPDVMFYLQFSNSLTLEMDREIANHFQQLFVT